MQAFNVKLGKKIIDVVFYGDNMNIDCGEVRQSLINHDGYDCAIVRIVHRRVPI